MQLVINIPDELYQSQLSDDYIGNIAIRNAIVNGVPLPKGHGKLVDVNSIPEEDRDIMVKGLLYPGTIAFAGAIDLEQYINNLQTIIEVDKPESEDKG